MGGGKLVVVPDNPVSGLEEAYLAGIREALRRDEMSQTELAMRTETAHHQQVFQEAVKNGDTGSLRRLLAEKAVNVNVFDPEGQTALHQSVLDGNLELVKLLVKFGADVRLANRDVEIWGKDKKKKKACDGGSRRVRSRHKKNATEKTFDFSSTPLPADLR
ncbi:NRARP [Branchiostoma lanceolatum]|uniref:NRARP protein n=1 Tax=Branchiostoma lanceolatum TaxID=7740 RepID=A0A8K0AE82_BRALA|nr:NRARP [Branchiostoma lanceolatum]